MEPLVSILLAEKERWPAANWIWLAALVILTVLSYIARRAAEKAEKAEKEQQEREMEYRADPKGPPGRAREARMPPVPVRHARPAPTGPPAAPRGGGAAAGAHGTVRVAPGTITQVQPGTLTAEHHLEPVAVSDTVTEPLPPPETPGRLAPAIGPRVVLAGIVNRMDLRTREEAARAVIYAEILGAPKALREGPESWER